MCLAFLKRSKEKNVFMMTNVIFNKSAPNHPGHITYVYMKSCETAAKMISLVKVDSLRLLKLKMTLPHQLKLCASFGVYQIENKADTDGTVSINICEILC